MMRRKSTKKQNLIKFCNLCLTVKFEFMTLLKNSHSASLAKRRNHFWAKLPKKIGEYEEDKKKLDNKTRQLENEIDILYNKIKEMIEWRVVNDEHPNKLYQIGVIDI